MYSLDQVIYFLDQRQQTEDWNIRDAAIAYLRGYREILPDYAQMKLDAVNDPLTWDELKQMEGTPVWIVMGACKIWGLNDGVYVDAFGKEMVTIKVLHDLWHLRKDKIGIDWQAYRKERK